MYKSKIYEYSIEREDFVAILFVGVKGLGVYWVDDEKNIAGQGR